MLYVENTIIWPKNTYIKKNTLEGLLRMFSLVLQSLIRKIIIQFFARICWKTRLETSSWLKNSGWSHGRSCCDGGQVRLIIILINKLIIFHYNITYLCARSISKSGKFLQVDHCSLTSSSVISSGRAFLKISNWVNTLWGKSDESQDPSSLDQSLCLWQIRFWSSKYFSFNLLNALFSLDLKQSIRWAYTVKG